MTTRLGRSCSFGLLCVYVVGVCQICVYPSYPFGIEGRMWVVIVLIPDHNLSIYFPLTDRAKEISAFVTSDGLNQYKDMSWNENSRATFQRLINTVITRLDICNAYIDYAIIYGEEWDQQLKTIREFFERLSKAKLTINLAKSEFCHANLTFLDTLLVRGR